MAAPHAASMPRLVGSKGSAARNSWPTHTLNLWIGSCLPARGFRFLSSCMHEVAVQYSLILSCSGLLVASSTISHGHRYAHRLATPRLDADTTPHCRSEHQPRQTHGRTGLSAFDTAGFFFFRMGISAHGAGAMCMHHAHASCRCKSHMRLLSARPSSGLGYLCCLPPRLKLPATYPSRMK